MIDDSTALVELAKNGVGIAIVLDVAVEDALAKGELVQLLPEIKMHSADIFLVYQSQRYLPKRSLLFKDFMIRPGQSAAL